MKKLISIIAITLFASSAFAASKDAVLMNISTSATGSAYRMPGVFKSVTFAGYDNAGSASNVPGTVTLQTAPTANGPWVGAKDVANVAVSNAAAANSTFNLKTAYQWFRATFTKSATGRTKVFMSSTSGE